MHEVLPYSVEINQFCESGITTNNDLKLVIYIEDKLSVGSVFEYNFGLGSKFWAVTYSQDGIGSDEDHIIDGTEIVLVNFCNNPNTYKHHRLQYLGSSTSELESNYCDRIQTDQYRTKVDIRIANILNLGEVYYINESVYTYPAGYYYVKYSGYHDGSDEDDVIDDSSVISIYNLNDSDDDNVVDICDNCPNNSNSNQADLDGDGLGNVCDNDIDGDGIINSNDDCPNVFGVPQNNGCPADSDGDGVPDSEDSCPSDYGTQSDGCPTLPDLTLSSLKINNGNIFPGGVIPTFEYNEAINFEIKINNTGEANSGNFTCLILAGGSPTSYPGPNYASPAYSFATANFSNIDGGDDRTVNITAYANGSIGGLELYEGQTYYMFIDIDYNSSVVESEGVGENNNLKSFVFEYSCPSCRVAYLNTSNGTIDVPLDNVENNNIKIYNINNVSFPVVNQAIDQEETLNLLLQPGIYAIHINDTFVKKFKL